ncbi:MULTISPECIES: response regulator [Nitrosomonas]|uniref:Virulence sensor protein BvgS n=1 Tax=Nitrosomonas communis TaxID=44574 RepID=A0A0F7KIB7_9PROT|nr:MULTISPECIES: response regulator [Nitrosomonas]AKH38868.1 histidine kinase [Nitrosomonas communis]TYP91923.1 signal transduction histidine kinase [Nitrosomonas communis]UVS60995.1 response regulator [Nitrosomonas sp. PLL12]
MDMTADLTEELDVRLLLKVLTALKKGNFVIRMPSDWTGLPGKIADTLNDIIEINQQMARGLTQVSRVVGREGQLTQRVPDLNVAGGWAAKIKAVNTLIDDLVRPTTEMARVISAVAKGDLSQMVALDVDGRPLKGQFLSAASTANTMVDQLNSFASEVTRVAREVGTEGKLGGQAHVPGIAGIWKDLTDSVNSMAGNLTSQVRNIAEVTTAVANGDLSKKITVDVKGEILELKNTINVMVDQLNSFASEVTRVAREVGTEGKLGGQAHVPGVAGTWKDLTDSVNSMAGNLTSQVRNIAEVTTAVANGDLSKKITVDVKGEILRLKNTINVMVDQLSSFAAEVTRVAREVGTEGKLGGQAYVPGVGGTWKDLTDNVNSMASNLTGQVRNIAEVTTAVANGDLSKKITVDVKGEILELKNTINVMVDQLSSFAAEVTRVAREVGTEGKLGGQASVPGAAGTWKDLTENVNQLAANLTNQVRAIAEVATAVTRGDLSRSIQVEARGEVSHLKDNINEMIRNLKETTQKNAQQDWLKTNLARFTRLLQGYRELDTVTRLILSELAPLVSAHHGIFYLMDVTEQDERLRMVASYGYRPGDNGWPTSFALGEGLVGQCALEKKCILLTNVPGDYIKISSGLGAAVPTNIIVLPILFDEQIKAVIEIGSLECFTETRLSFLGQLMESIGVVLNMIEVNSRTESLLAQSQSLAHELQQTNRELGEKARLLSEQNIEVERKNREVEHAKLALEEKAAQLALSSKYKSEFLANMSHELRTPLNSLLVLAQQLSDNPAGNLTHKQVEFANTIYSSGSDLLTLINDILDLSKIESGTVTLEISEYSFQNLCNYLERTFRHMAEAKRISFSVELASDLPFSMMTDITRLQQILKNLLSNAFKFTTHGSVSLKIALAQEGWSVGHPALSQAAAVLAFSVTDTGMGITPDKLQLIFEAFQQADGSTARKYGGTGLGLSISRELACMLNGEIRVQSKLNIGSTFTLFLPYDNSVLTNDELVSQSSSQAAALTDNVIYMPEQAFDHTKPAEPANTVVMTTVEDATLDDRALIASGSPSILIVEDDPRLAQTLLDCAHEKNFKGIVAAYGDSVLALARDHLPTVILLDIDRHEADGLSVLDRLKRDPGTRHIPVHILSNQKEGEYSLRLGAISYLVKPVSLERLQEEFIHMQQFLSNHKRSLLVVENDRKRRNAMIDLIGESDVHIVTAETGQQALDILQSDHFDCMVLDPTPQDINGLDLLDMISKDESLRTMPVVIYAAKKLERKEVAKLKHISKTIVVKEARSPERLLDETALFLHRPLASLPEPKRRMLDESQAADNGLSGRQVLIVDDDLRNLFALSSVLEQQQMKVLFAENGKDGIEVLKNNPSIEIVLMDIMMPEMDGYDTMRTIRCIPRFKQLPIITLTAKAMKGDRDKCIAAGASDYITKPVDVARLLSMMRVWLHK